MTSQRRPRVLILGDRAVVALAACRALGRAGYEVGIAGSRHLDVAGLSRHASRYHRVPPIDAAGAAWGQAVQALVIDVGYEAVVASSDAGVARMLGNDLRVPTCPRITAEHLPLIDKGLLALLCAGAAVDYPITDVPAHEDDDRDIALSVRRVTVVKAARSAVATSAGVIRMPGAHVVSDHASAAEALAYVRGRGADPVVQEYVEGEKLQAMIIRRDRITYVSLTFFVRREFPPSRGAEAMLEGLGARSRLGGQMVGMLERLADAAGYEGFLGAEFLLTAAGRLCVIDVNPRLGGALAFAELLGLGMAERAVRDVLGLASMPMPADPAGRRYHHLDRELRWLRAQKKVPKGYFATFATRDVWDIPSVTDPLPDLLRVRRWWEGKRAGARPGSRGGAQTRTHQ